MFVQLLMASSSQLFFIEGLVEVGDDLEHIDRATLWEQQVDIITVLREKAQNQPLREFRVGRLGVNKPC